MSTSYYSSSGRRPHLWRIRAEGHRELLIAKGWGLCGGYARKRIHGREVMVTTVEKNSDYDLCRFQLKDDFWTKATADARQREALERRSFFKIVQSGSNAVDQPDRIPDEDSQQENNDD